MSYSLIPTWTRNWTNCENTHTHFYRNVPSLHLVLLLTFPPRVSRIAQISVSPSSNSSGSAVGVLKEVQRKASPRRNLHHRRKMEVESDGSTEETDSSEN